MKRLFLAGSLILIFAFVQARADDALESLVGMALSVSSDKGPQAGAIPPDRVPSAPSRAASEILEAEPQPASASPGEVPASAPAVRTGPARSASAASAAPAVFAPGAAPRVWTRLFASLLPPMARAAAFEVAVSTRPQFARPATAASVAGAAQGLLEIVSAATAPSQR